MSDLHFNYNCEAILVNHQKKFILSLRGVTNAKAIQTKTKIDCHDLPKGKSRNDKKVVDCFDFLQKSRNDRNKFGLLW